jgi:hypothetical protein
MLMNRINRADPEKVFIVAKNSWSTAALSNGQAVVWDYATDADGVGVTRPTAGAVRAGHLGTAFAGIATEAIAVSDYGLLQVYGYHSAVRVRSQTGGTPIIAAGTALTCTDSTAFVLHSFEPGTLATSTLTVHNAHYVGFALAAQALWTTTAIACFIKGL